MKLSQLLSEQIATSDLVTQGKLVKVELYATPDLATRLAKFLADVGNYTATGASRSIGIIDDSKAKDLQLFIDGDGNDRIRDVKVVKKQD